MPAMVLENAYCTAHEELYLDLSGVPSAELMPGLYLKQSGDCAAISTSS